MEEGEKTEIPEVIVKKKRPVEKFLKVLSIAVGVILLLIIFIAKYNVPEFPWGIVVTLTVVIAVGTIGIFFNFEILRWFKARKEKKEGGEEKLPPRISLEQARAIVNSALVNPQYADHVLGYESEETRQIGKAIKSTIYICKVKGVYESSVYYILINMHYPTELRAILINPSKYELIRAINSLAVSPEDEPDVEETTTHGPLGTVTTTKKTRSKKASKTTTPEKAGELT